MLLGGTSLADATNSENTVPLFRIRLEELQPTQFLLSLRKLGAAALEIAPAQLRPFPVRRIKERLSLTDGHHTAVLALLMGISTVTAYYDADAMDWEAYGRCEDACRSRGVHALPDLIGRLVTDNVYQREWHGWCDSIH
jgi:hypothetical protein